jgi:hypothetical protein
MKESPSAYGGVAAVLVLGIGLLIVGFNLPPEQYDRAVAMRWIGAVAVVLGLVGTAVTLSKTTAHKALFVGIGTMIYAGFLAYNAASSELSGTAHYFHQPDYLGFSLQGEAVTRDASPAKFRSATNDLWELSGLCLGFSLISFILYRKLDD